MFGIIRLIISFIFLVCSIIAIRKSKVARKYILHIVSMVMSVVLIVVLTILPFENLFITFNSPERAYEYYCFDRSNIALVLEGEYCSFVVDNKKESNSYLIIPKTQEGWKIGIGLNTRIVAQRYYEGISVCVYQYKNTNDFFITVLDTNGGEATIKDIQGNEFYQLTRKNEYLGKTFVTYYAHISDFDSQYSITVNGNTIKAETQGT